MHILPSHLVYFAVYFKQFGLQVFRTTRQSMVLQSTLQPSAKKRWKTIEKGKMSESSQQKYLDQLLAAGSTQDLVKIHNNLLNLKLPYLFCCFFGNLAKCDNLILI